MSPVVQSHSFTFALDVSGAFTAAVPVVLRYRCGAYTVKTLVVYQCTM